MDNYIKHLIYDFSTQITLKAKKLPADATTESMDFFSYLREEVEEIVTQAIEKDRRELNGVIKVALSVADELGGEGAPHHMQYCIDQMVRVLTNCQTETLINESGANGPFAYEGLGESEDYRAFKHRFRDRTKEDWDSGVAP